MNAAILCPGPSLLDTFPGRDGYDLLIAVNRASLVTTVNWWVFIDAKQWTDYRPHGIPKLFTTLAIDRSFKYWPDYQSHERLLFEDVTPQHPDTFRWRTFSSTAAMILACYLGADSIDLYGADMTGIAEYDGEPAQVVNRNDGRWRKETAIMQSTTEHLSGRGMTVNRILPKGRSE